MNDTDTVVALKGPYVIYRTNKCIEGRYAAYRPSIFMFVPKIIAINFTDSYAYYMRNSM